jgi:hypothetical protein
LCSGRAQQRLLDPAKPVLIKPYKSEQGASLGILKMSYVTARKGDISRSSGRPGRYQLSRRFPISTLENGLSFQTVRGRGIVESATSKPPGVAICPHVLGTGTYPAFLPPTGTSGLLAVLQLRVCLIGTDCFWKRTRLLHRKTSGPLGKNGSPSDTYC